MAAVQVLYCIFHKILRFFFMSVDLNFLYFSCLRLHIEVLDLTWELVLWFHLYFSGINIVTVILNYVIEHISE